MVYDGLTATITAGNTYITDRRLYISVICASELCGPSKPIQARKSIMDKKSIAGSETGKRNSFVAWGKSKKTVESVDNLIEGVPPPVRLTL